MADEGNEEAVLEQLAELRRELRLLEWDRAHNQLNDGKLPRLRQLQASCAELEAKLNAQREQ